VLQRDRKKYEVSANGTTKIMESPKTIIFLNSRNLDHSTLLFSRVAAEGISSELPIEHLEKAAPFEAENGSIFRWKLPMKKWVQERQKNFLKIRQRYVFPLT